MKALLKLCRCTEQVKTCLYCTSADDFYSYLLKTMLKTCKHCGELGGNSFVRVISIWILAPSVFLLLTTSVFYKILYQMKRNSSLLLQNHVDRSQNLLFEPCWNFIHIFSLCFIALQDYHFTHSKLSPFGRVVSQSIQFEPPDHPPTEKNWLASDGCSKQDSNPQLRRNKVSTQILKMANPEVTAEMKILH